MARMRLGARARASLRATTIVTSLAIAVGLATLRIAWAQPSLDSETVVDQLAQARTATSLDRALALFADDAVITVQAGKATQVFAGRDQVRAYLQAVALPSRVLMRSTYRVDGPFVRWTERLEQPHQMVDATVQATVQSGRIETLVVQQNEPFGSSVAAPSAELNEAHEAPSLAWAAALGSGFLLVVGFFFRPRRRASRSGLSGRLVRSLRLTRSER
jgi:hypothetical protein